MTNKHAPAESSDNEASDKPRGIKRSSLAQRPHIAAPTEAAEPVVNQLLAKDDKPRTDISGKTRSAVKNTGGNPEREATRQRVMTVDQGRAERPVVREKARGPHGETATTLTATATRSVQLAPTRLPPRSSHTNSPALRMCSSRTLLCRILPSRRCNANDPPMTCRWAGRTACSVATGALDAALWMVWWSRILASCWPILWREAPSRL